MLDCTLKIQWGSVAMTGTLIQIFSSFSFSCAGVCVAEPDVNINVNININGDGDPKDKPPPPIDDDDGLVGGEGSGGGPWGGGPPPGQGGGLWDIPGPGGPWGDEGLFPPSEGWKPQSRGPCPNITVVQDFDLARYLGRWYEIERMYNPFQYGGCTTATYSLRPDGTVKVLNSNGVNGSRWDTLEGTGIPSNVTGEGSLSVSFPMSGTGGYESPQVDGNNYHILKTDYDNYSIVYTCATIEIPGAPVKPKIEFGWILARAPTLASDTLEMIKTHLGTVNIDYERFNPTNQTDCPRLPLK